MAKQKSKGAKLGAAVKAAASGGITKQEFSNIVEQFNVDAGDVVQKMDKINKNTKAKGETPYLSLNSGAANMLINQSGKSQYNPYMPSPYGSGSIGKSLQEMIGDPGFSGYTSKGQTYGSKAATPSQMMILGTQIRPGGRVAVQGFGSSPRATGLPSGGSPTEPSVSPDDSGAGRTADPSRRAAAQDRVAAMRSAVDAYSAANQPPTEIGSASIDGMTGGGMGISGAMGLRRPNSRWRQERRTSKGTNNFRRSLQIGSPINLA